MRQLTVYKGRTNIVPVSLGFDISGDTFKSEIRTQKDFESPLIATWDISFATDGTDGELVLRLDNSVTQAITKSTGYMDIVRYSGGEPLSVFDEPLEVLFKNSVTQ